MSASERHSCGTVSLHCVRACTAYVPAGVRPPHHVPTQQLHTSKVLVCMHMLAYLHAGSGPTPPRPPCPWLRASRASPSTGWARRSWWARSWRGCASASSGRAGCANSGERTHAHIIHPTALQQAQHTLSILTPPCFSFARKDCVPVSCLWSCGYSGCYCVADWVI